MDFSMQDYLSIYHEAGIDLVDDISAAAFTTHISP